MKIEIIAIGNELVAGEIENTNSSYLARELTLRGFEISTITSVGDDEWAIENALLRSRDQADGTIVTGGLGPAQDDITAKSAARAFKCPLVLNKEALQKIREHFEQRGMEMPPSNEKQAFLPQHAELIPNPIGTAPGFMMSLRAKWFIFLPSIPGEMKALFHENVLPMLEKRRTGGHHYRVKILKVFGLDESLLADQLQGIHPEDYSAALSFSSHFPETRLRISVRGKSIEESENKLTSVEKFILDQIGDCVFADDSATMEEIVGHLLRSKKATLAIAESCTGGLLGHLLTSVPGSSAYFERGIIAYSNQAKTSLLNVPEDLLIQVGAVSAPVADKMAEGIREISGATIGLGITGIAGPSGGTPEKPVGTVFIAIACAAGTASEEYHFVGDREQIKMASAYTALDWIRRYLLVID